jgi:hypothetical protein
MLRMLRMLRLLRNIYESKDKSAMSALKIKEFPGLQRISPETIEKHTMEQSLRDAQYALDVQLHDLRSEFLHREGKLRQEYLDAVAEIASA